MSSQSKKRRNEKLGEYGFQTSNFHDSCNIDFTDQNGLCPRINKIDCYYTDEYIIGLFPIYDNSSLQKEVQTESYYPEFLKNVKKIEEECNKKNLHFKHEISEFPKGLNLNYIKIIYDDNEHKVLAMKYSTDNNKVNSYGNHTLFKTKDPIMLAKDNHFICGFKSCFLKDNKDVPYLSYIRVHFCNKIEFNKVQEEIEILNINRKCSLRCVYKLFSWPLEAIMKGWRFGMEITDEVIKLIILLGIIIVPVYLYIYSKEGVIGEKKYNRIK